MSGPRTAKAPSPYLRRSRHTHRFAAPVSCCTFWKTPNPTPSAPPSSGWCAPSPVTCRYRSRSSWRPMPRSPKSPMARRCGPNRNPRSRLRTTPISIAALPGSLMNRRSPSTSMPKDGKTIRRCFSFRVRGRSICSIPIARAGSSFTSSVFSSPTMPRYCRAICASSAAWSIAPICRSMSREKKSRKARCSPPSGKARPAACLRSWSGSPTRSRIPTRRSGTSLVWCSRRVSTRTSSAVMRCSRWRASRRRARRISGGA